MSKIENASLSDADLIKKCQELLQEHRQIINDYNKLYIDTSKHIKIVSKKYGVGGEVFHRGYFCPSPVEDLVIGNAHRGKLIKEINQKVTHIYSYDVFGRLVEIETTGSIIDKEYIWYDDNVQYSVIISGVNRNASLISTSRCIYDNDKLIKYEFTTVLLETLENGDVVDYKIADISVEEYFYNQRDELSEVLSYMYFEYRGEPYIANRRIQQLIRNDANEVTSLNVYDIKNGNINLGGYISVPKFKQRII